MQEKRKLTQMELAEKLGVTDRSISNWENGVCLPDASLYKSLCDILHITIYELFAGEFICSENYKNAADDNLLMLLEHRLYDASSKEITFDDFPNSRKRFTEIALLLQRYGDKQEAVAYLVNETRLSEEECIAAYDIYMRMFDYK